MAKPQFSERDKINRRELFRHALQSTSRFIAALKGEKVVDAPVAKRSGRKPNFVFILTDDMGWKDLSCYGSSYYETPNIDRLARGGMKFTNAYAAAPVCSPTRASILTGKYPARLHLTDWIPGHTYPNARLRVPDWCQYLPLQETTIAQVLKSAGYVTANIGKWHLGDEPYYPEKHGFDLNFGGTNQGFPPSYFCPYNIPTIPACKQGEYLTDRLTDEALAFIERSRDRPFFLLLSHYALHTPLMAKKELVDKYTAKTSPDFRQNNPIYAAMTESVDTGVGKIMAKLDELGIAEDTVVIFTSDNGGLCKVTSQFPLRSGKGNLYEGGIRVPLIIRWPGNTQQGTTCDVPVASIDFYPTILRLADVEETQNIVTDGISLIRLLMGKGGFRRDALYWHYPHYHTEGGTPSGAVRSGEYKLIEFFEDAHAELYNLRNDIGEQHDLSEEMPDLVARLKAMLAEWRESVSAQMPSPNRDCRTS